MNQNTTESTVTVETLDDVPEHVLRGLPEDVRLFPSAVDKTRLGVWATKSILKGKKFGPFVGDKKKRSQVKSNVYMWEVYYPNLGWMCVDATDPEKGNWLRYINWARSGKEQNLFPLEINRTIYYKSLKPIAPGEELLVWYNGEDDPEIAAAIEEERASARSRRHSPKAKKAVESLHSLNDQISHFIVNKSKTLDEDEDAFLPSEKESLKNAMMLMRHLLMDAQAKILHMMDDNKQLALRIDGALQAAGQEVTALRAELAATGRRLAELGSDPAMEHGPHSAQALLREEVAQLQEEVHLLRQMKEMLTKDLEETHGSKSPEVLSATELKVQLAQKEQELARAKEALQAMKADRKRLKAEKTDLVSQMQQLYATLESREEQLRDFIRNYEQHRKESEDAVKALAKEKDLLEREKWELRRQAKEATDHASALRSQLDLKDNRMKELEAELAMAKQSLATLTKDVPKRHSLAMPGETVLNGNQEWVMQADLPLTAAIRQSQQTLYHSHPQHSADRQAVRVSPCHSRQPSIISDASAAEGDRSSTPSDINSPRHRTHSLCNGDSPGPVQKNLHNPIVQSLEDLEDQKRKKKKEKMGFGSISRVFARGKQRKSLDPGLFDGTAPDYYIEEDADW
ncbi:kazrin isoform X5 [Aquila chrysaetos chrysaetos]|nr:kazrin isoform X5 [Aquila chrysaetos chrysaetos]